ncbi:MAG: amidohydrolase family protein [Acidimicrobiia bacterium]
MKDALLIRRVEVRDRIVDVLVLDGRVAAMGDRLPPPRGAHVVDGNGGALLAGLHDHHVHLLAMAAAPRSIDASQLDQHAFVEALRAADRGNAEAAWLRVTGYHESVNGPLDRATLDGIVPDRPVRVQHATGAMWVCNSAGLHAAQVSLAPPQGVERDVDGVMTGRLYALDEWLARVLPREPVDLEPVGRDLTDFGVTGVTDMTPYRDARDLRVLRDAVSTGTPAQRVVITGAPALDRSDVAPLVCGPAKIVVDDIRSPDLDGLAGEIAHAHALLLPVALHCASRLGVVLALAALEAGGSFRGDRIEHGAVIPPELFARLHALGVTVVTQPAFVHTRGDRYLSDVEPCDVPHLWRCKSLLDANIAVAFGSDAPYGPADPWVAIRAATTRRTRAGRAVGTGERLAGRDALARFLTPWHDPGGAPRRVEPGTPADLCLLHEPLAEALRDPTSDAVRATIIDGSLRGS